MPSIDFPAEINARVRIQSANIDDFRDLCRRGFWPETMEFGGWLVMRRDFHDGNIREIPSATVRSS